MLPLELVLGISGAALLLGVVVVHLLRSKGRDRLPRGSGPPKNASPDTSKPAAPPVRPDPAASLPRFHREDDDELDITRVTVPAIEETSIDEETLAREPPLLPIVYDEEAAIDIPTANQAYILVFAAGSTHVGKRRRKNEDNYLVLEEPPLFVVADGMGGYAGGEVASGIAVEEIGAFFNRASPDEPGYAGLPRRGAEVVRAIRRANRRILERARDEPSLEGMGTTIVCARFSPNKQRLYLGHVGDSRCYLLRNDVFSQVTTDHTAATEGIPGPLGSTLTRALGVRPQVDIDLILAEPRPGDRYLLCSDGLNKMVPDEGIHEILRELDEPDRAVETLIAAANAKGGRDNVTVVVVRVDPPPTPQKVTPPPTRMS
jgi:serine/threonine protein phosphatase PrpC